MMVLAVEEPKVKPKVLVVEDESQVLSVIATYLESDGFEVVTATDGSAALSQFYGVQPDVVVLDLMLPRLNGIEVLKSLRKNGNVTPVIVISARGGESDRVAGLDLGADDYMPKPVSPREISARVRAVLRRSAGPGNTCISFGEVEIEVASRVVRRNGEFLNVRPKEFDLLVELASRPGEVMTRSALLQKVWGSSPEWQDPGTVTVHIRRLRRLVEVDAASPRHIVTVYGVGYRFDG